MNKKREIPTILPNLSDEFHFGKVVSALPFSRTLHLFHLNRLEDARAKMKFPLPPHRKVVNDIIFITKGESVRYKGLNKYEFGKNQLFFLPAFQITAHKAMSEDVEGYFIHFSPEILRNFSDSITEFSFTQFSSNPVVSIPDENIPYILNLFQRLESIYANWKKSDLQIAVFYLLTLLAEINQLVDAEPQVIKKDASTILTEQYKNALTQHIYQKQTIQEYAQLLFVSPNHLNKCVKKTLDKTAKNLLDEMLILESKSLLKYSNLAISEIAEKLLGTTPGNFTRFFKSRTGMTPKAYLEK